MKRLDTRLAALEQALPPISPRHQRALAFMRNHPLNAKLRRVIAEQWPNGVSSADLALSNPACRAAMDELMAAFDETELAAGHALPYPNRARAAQL